jgi:hypothetical protein
LCSNILLLHTSPIVLLKDWHMSKDEMTRKALHAFL